MKSSHPFLLALVVGLFMGCTPAPCDYVACGPGECVEGICDCPEGFSGENCEVEECFGVPCLNGECDPQTESCECDPNYYGEGCDTLCVNGEFATGDCHCAEGYEGIACDTEMRDRFVSTWDVLEWTSTSEGGPTVPGHLPGTLRLRAGYTILEVEMYLEERYSGLMLFSSEERIRGDVAGNTVTFALQDLIVESTVYGSARLDAGVLTMELYFFNPTTSLTEEAIGTFLQH